MVGSLQVAHDPKTHFSIETMSGTRTTTFLLLSLFAFAAAFTAPQNQGIRSSLTTSMSAAPKMPQVDKSTLFQAAVLAPVFAATPASAFSTDYLPAVLVPVMTLFLPAMGMALGFILVEKEEI